MNTYIPLGNSILARLVFKTQSEIIHIEQGNSDVSKFADVIAVGPDVKAVSVGDEILVPQMKDGRELFMEGEKTYAVFSEDSAQLIKEII